MPNRRKKKQPAMDQFLTKKSPSTIDDFFFNEQGKFDVLPRPMKSEITDDVISFEKSSQSNFNVCDSPGESSDMSLSVNDTILVDSHTTEFSNVTIENVLDLSIASTSTSTRTTSRSSSIESGVSSLTQSDYSIPSLDIDSSSSPPTHTMDDSASTNNQLINGLTEAMSTTATRVAESRKNKKKANSKSNQEEKSFDFEKYKGIISKWSIGDGKGNLVRCEICMKYPELVKQLCTNRKRPPITTSVGTGNRTIVLDDHVESKYHLACMNKYKNEKLKATTENSTPTELIRMISTANTEKANTISRYIISVYTDAKALTAAAHSWPGRIFASEYCRQYNINEPELNANAMQKINLQYMNPVAYGDFLHSIVHVENNLIMKKLYSCLAISLRADGSIDRTCIDKIYVLAKIVNAEGKLETLFLGVGEQEERGAKGLYATIESIVNAHENNLWDKLLKKMSSFVTDGASINVGEHKGLWRLIDEAALAAGAQQPIIKIWCAAHRSDLAMKDLAKNVAEVPNAIKKCASMGSFVRRSAVRLGILKRIAREKNLELNILPTYHDVRWSEFSLQLVSSILTSWRCLVYLFQEMIDIKDDHSAEARGYIKFLTDFDNLELLCFLGDVFQIHSIFQKQLQSDALNIISLHEFVNEFNHNINNLHGIALLGGWEETLKAYCEQKDDAKFYIGDIEVEKPHRRVASVRSFAFLREKILRHIGEFTNIRFSTPTDLACDVMMPFFQFKNNDQVHVRNVHEILASDVDISLLCIQFQRICNNVELKNMALTQLLRHLINVETTNSYTELIIVLARLLAATPHSADVERSISANNLLKTALKSCLKISTENNFLFVHFNLPPLSKWNPQNAVNHWLTVKDRRVHNLTVENENRKTKKQPFFKGIFSHDEIEVDIVKLNELRETKRRRCF